MFGFDDDFDLFVFNGGRYFWVESGPDFEFLRDEAIYDMVTGARMFAPSDETDAFAIDFCAGPAVRERRVELATDFLSSGTGIEPDIVGECVVAETDFREMEGRTRDGEIVYRVGGTFQHFVDFRSVDTGDIARLVFTDPAEPRFALTYGLALQPGWSWAPRRCATGSPDLAPRAFAGEQVFLTDGRLETSSGPLLLAETDLLFEPAEVAAVNGTLR